MNAVLLILKILGIILAVIVGIIILVICLVLFAPVTYKIVGQGKDEKVHADVTMKWLLGLVSIKGVISSSALEFKTHLAGKEMVKKENSRLSRILKKIAMGIWELLKKHFFGINPAKKVIGTENGPNTQTAKAAANSTDAAENKKMTGDEKDGADTKGEDEEENPGKLVRKLRAVKEKIQKIWELIKLAKYVLGAPVTARAWKYFKEQFGVLINHIKPRSVAGTAVFGTGDPATTAQAYGIAGCFAALIDERLIIVPDMESKIIDLDVTIKGRIMIGYVLSFLWKLLTEKNIRRVVGYIGRNL